MYMNSPPAPNDFFTWLILIQHYGCKTRILDWSENLLVALYFATDTNSYEKDGYLWVLMPWRLNGLTTGQGVASIFFHDDSPVQYYCREAYYVDRLEDLLEELKLEKKPEFPLGASISHSFSRGSFQESCMTIHPNPRNEEGELLRNQLLDLIDTNMLPDTLGYYLVPASCKAKIRRELFSIGFHPEKIFADLDNLSKSIFMKLDIMAQEGDAVPPRLI